jgi:hypothetical protein
MEEAQRRLFEPDTQSTIRMHDDYDVVEMPPSKRKRMDVDYTDELALPTKAAKNQVTNILEESSKIQHNVLELDLHLSNDNASQIGQQVQTGSNQVRSWGLAPSLKRDFVDHEPMLLFPEESSTIPFGTGTQERLIDEAIRALEDPNTLSTAFLDANQSSKSSIPWSEYLKSSPNTSSNTQTAAPVVNHDPNSSTSTKLRLTPPPQSKTKLARRNTGVPELGLKEQPIRSKTTSFETINEHESEDEISIVAEKSSKFKSNSSLEAHLSNENGPNNSKLSLNGKKRGYVVVNETSSSTTHSKTNVETYEQTENLQNSASSKSCHMKATEEEDELSIDFPKEHYIPRPSRSRSRRIEEEPIDYSVRPERAKKTRSASKKLLAVSGDTLGHDAKIGTITSMGFSVEKAEAALEKANGSVETAIELLCNGTVQSPQQLNQCDVMEPPSNSLQDGVDPKRIDGPVQAPEVAMDAPIEETSVAKTDVGVSADSDQSPATNGSANTTSLPYNLSNINVEASTVTSKAISRSSAQIVRKKKAKRSKTMPVRKLQLSDSEAEEEEPDPLELTILKRGQGQPPPKSVLDEELPQSGTTCEKGQEIPPVPKRGRGRPKKAAVEQPIATAVVEPAAAEIVNVNDPVERGTLNAQSIDTGTVQASDQTTAETCPRETIDTPEQAAPSTPPAVHNSSDNVGSTAREEAALSSPPQKPMTGSCSGHSPLSKSKVPFRVGLSKKSRIAPLLKIVRK